MSLSLNDKYLQGLKDIRTLQKEERTLVRIQRFLFSRIEAAVLISCSLKELQIICHH